MYNNIIFISIQLLYFPTAEQAGIKYSTQPAFQVPEDMKWKEVGLQLKIYSSHQRENEIISGGSNPLPLTQWEEIKVRYPWQKNIDRHILINKTALVRSPNAKANCNQTECLIERDYKGYSWIELAQPLAVDFIPSKTNMLKPEKGYLVIKIIKKCQILRFENEIYQLTEKKLLCHARYVETGEPNLDVILE